MKKFLLYSTSAMLLGSAVVQPIQTINHSNIVHASDRAYFTEKTGIYPERFGSARKAIANPSAVAIVETSTDGWYKVKTYLGDMWMKNGFTDVKNPDKPIVYTYTTKPSGLFNEANKGTRVASINPQRVIVVEAGNNGWIKIQTWKGDLWIKDGVMGIGDDQVVAPTPTPETPTPPVIETPEVPETPVEPPVVEPTEPAIPETPVEEVPTEPVDPPAVETPEVPSEPIEEVPAEPTPEPNIPEVPVVETPVEPEVPVVKPAEPQPEYVYFSQSGGLYASQFDSKKISTVSPQRLTVIERGEDGWIKVKTWLGDLWTKEGFTADKSPIKVMGVTYATKTSGLYKEPYNVSKSSVVSPQRLTVLEQGEDGWIKVQTWLGGMWMKDGFNEASSPKKTLGYVYLTQTSGIYKEQNGGTKSSVVSPQRLAVLQYGENGWFKTSTWLGDMWIKDGYNVNVKQAVPAKKQANTSLTHIQMTRDAVIFEDMLGSTHRVGEAMSGQQFVLLGQDETHYLIDFGQGKGIINKEAAVIASSVKYDNAIDGKEINRSLITLKDASVYKSPGSFSEKIGIVKDNMRYPIVSEEEGWYIIDFAGRKGYISKAEAKSDKGVPILMYHHFLERWEGDRFFASGTTVSADNFEKQMAYLKQQSFVHAMPGDIEKFVNKQTNLPGKTVGITIDDGYKSNARYAAPVLEKYGYKATVFYLTKWLQQRTSSWDASYTQWMSIEEMRDTANAFEFHSHTHNMHHGILQKDGREIGAINILPYEEAVADIKQNLDMVEEVVGYRSEHFAYPFGHNSQKAQDVLKANNIKTAYTTTPGFVNPGDNPLTLNRYNMNDFVSMSAFETYLGHK